VDISATQLEKAAPLTSAPCTPCKEAPACRDVTDIVSQLSSFLLKEDGHSLTLGGLSEQSFRKADDEARVNHSDFPKWEGMR
jgi:hypothetical protein